MSLTVVTSGTVTPTVNVLSVLDTETPASPAFYIMEVDTVNLALGDTLVLSIQTAVLGGGTKRVVYRGVYARPQAQPIKLSPPVPADTSIEFDLLQTGTARAFPWKIYKL